MPEAQSAYFYTCTHCSKVLKPIFGDCCVFSCGTMMCPTEQRRALSEAERADPSLCRRRRSSQRHLTPVRLRDAASAITTSQSPP